MAAVNSYATNEDLDAYIEGGLPSGYEEEFITRVLELASRDVDVYSNAYPYGGNTALKFAADLDPLTFEEALPDYSVAAIVEATCAQAEYRLAKGDQFFVEAQPQEDGNREPRFAPKAVEALARAGIQLRTATAILG